MVVSGFTNRLPTMLTVCAMQRQGNNSPKAKVVIFFMLLIINVNIIVILCFHDANIGKICNTSPQKKYIFFFILRKVEKSWRDEGVKRLKKRAEMVL
jgi:hypothetical protein